MDVLQDLLAAPDSLGKTAHAETYWYEAMGVTPCDLLGNRLGF